MAEEYRVGAFALLCVIAVATVIALVGGPIWYAVGPVIVYLAYFAKVRIRRLRDDPRTVMAVLGVVSLAMVGFAVF